MVFGKITCVEEVFVVLHVSIDVVGFYQSPSV